MSTLKQTLNLGNSIIGVSILAMPHCFKQCGIILSITIIILSSLLNRASCHFLLKSAIISRRRSYELLAFHVFGQNGKLLVELGVLGFLLGTCVAFFVVIGDLGPSLVSQIFDIPNNPQLRAFVMTFLGMFVALPLGMLRRVESLTSFSALSLVLYAFLIMKMLSEASDNLLLSRGNIVNDLHFWESSSLLTTLPIFAMALSCQTQLFEIFDHVLLSDISSLKRMNHISKRAIQMCSLVYIAIGYLGYIAFYDQPFRGNILLFLSPSFASTITKVAFILTVVISFPLCLFPCRTSLHSFLFKKGGVGLITESSVTHMSDRHFKLLTVGLIVATIGLSILLPRIELVLGILGSTIGAVICFILPALIFIKLTEKNTNERVFAHVVVIIGAFILVACTFSTLKNIYMEQNSIEIEHPIHSTLKRLPALEVEPPTVNLTQSQANMVLSNLDPDALKKEDKEIKLQPQVPSLGSVQDNLISKEKEEKKRAFQDTNDLNKAKKQDELLQRLEKQQQEHKKLLEQQKEIISEMLKHKEVHHEENANKQQKGDKPLVHSNLTVNANINPNVGTKFNSISNINNGDKLSKNGVKYIPKEKEIKQIPVQVSSTQQQQQKQQQHQQQHQQQQQQKQQQQQQTVEQKQQPKVGSKETSKKTASLTDNTNNLKKSQIEVPSKKRLEESPIKSVQFGIINENERKEGNVNHLIANNKDLKHSNAENVKYNVKEKIEKKNIEANKKEKINEKERVSNKVEVKVNVKDPPEIKDEN